MGQAISSFTDSLGITNYGEQQAAAQNAQRTAQQAADQESARLAQQQKVIEEQRKAEQLALNAKQKNLAAAASGTSGFINTSPTPKDSILG